MSLYHCFLAIKFRIGPIRVSGLKSKDLSHFRLFISKMAFVIFYNFPFSSGKTSNDSSALQFESPAKRTRLALDSPAKSTRSQILNEEENIDSPTKRVPPLRISLTSRVMDDNTENDQASPTTATNSKPNSNYTNAQSTMFSSVTTTCKLKPALTREQERSKLTRLKGSRP